MRTICGLAVLAACVGLGALGAADEPRAEELLAAVQKKLRDAVARAGPSVATVVVSRSEHYPRPEKADAPGRLGGFDLKEFVRANPTTERTRLGLSLDLSDARGVAEHGCAGGVVIDPEGYVLTPYHVIDGATKVYVFLPGGTGSYADVHAADARADLAVLKLLAPPPKLQAVTFADVRVGRQGDKAATVYPGKLCVLLTNPYSSTFGLQQATAGFGSVTNTRYKPREFDTGGVARRATEYTSLLEYDIRPNAGLTGGVLLNLDGEMIGLTNAAAVAWGNEIGPGYAVPATASFRRIVDVLRRGEEVEYGFLGVTLNDGARPRVVVGALSPGGPAERAGLALGDHITHVNGSPVDDFHDLLTHVGAAFAGTKVRVTLSRFGRVRDADVTLSKFRHDMPSVASVRPEPVFGLRVDFEDLQTRAAPAGVDAWVTVREVVPNTPAAAKFKALGDNPTRWMVTHIDGKPATTPAAFYAAAKGRAAVKLTLLDSTEPNPRPRELTLP
ncbi:S1C family serine protease [Gemmata sp.]|uniref:S1C family serine protease n=1 Tax=Gemmata sp. TaxID=1914242 RepID=UPI003F704381